jgi:DNA topoisomerase IB
VLAGATAADAPQSRRPQLAAIDVAAHLLGNARAVARRSYIHPDAYRAGRAREVSEAVDAASELVFSRDVRDVLQVDEVVRTMVRHLGEHSTASVTADP